MGPTETCNMRSDLYFSGDGSCHESLGAQFYTDAGVPYDVHIIDFSGTWTVDGNVVTATCAFGAYPDGPYVLEAFRDPGGTVELIDHVHHRYYFQW